MTKKKKEEPKEVKDLKGLVELTPPFEIQRMRGIVQPKGKKGTWLRFLSDKRLCEVYYRLKSGQSAHSIAIAVKRDWGLKRNSKTESLARAIRAFKSKALRELDTGKYASPDKKKESKRAKQFLNRLKDKVDGLKYMADLIQIQMERIKHSFEQESGGLVSVHLDDAVKVLFNGIEKYVKLQIQLGVLDAKPEELRLHLQHRFGGVLEHVVKDRGDTMKQFASNLLENLEASSIPLMLGQDGVYSASKGEGEAETDQKK